MKALNTSNNHDGFSVYKRTSVARVCRGYRKDRDGDRNYGVLFDGKGCDYSSWVNVYPEAGDTKVFQGEYVYVSEVGQIVRDEDVKEAFDALAAW